MIPPNSTREGLFMKRFALPILLSAALALSIFSSGCSAVIKTAAEQETKDAASKAGVKYDDKTGGVTISTASGSAQIGGKIDWPSSWPSDLPKMDGTITIVSDTDLSKGGGIQIGLKVTGVDVVRKYGEQFAAMGYKKVFENNQNDTYSAAFASSKYTIDISFSGNSEAVILLGNGMSE